MAMTKRSRDRDGAVLLHARISSSTTSIAFIPGQHNISIVSLTSGPSRPISIGLLTLSQINNTIYFSITNHLKSATKMPRPSRQQEIKSSKSATKTSATVIPKMVGSSNLKRKASEDERDDHQIAHGGKRQKGELKTFSGLHCYNP